MNPIQRKVNSVEMNTNDHHGAGGGLRRLRRARLLTYAAAVAIVAALPVAAGAVASKPTLAKPNGLQTFQLRKGDHHVNAASGEVPTFSRTPAFAWNPVRGATRYEFELSTSNNFAAENAIIWSSKTLQTPAAAVPISLPWITGPALYWHVRAYGAGGVSDWSGTSKFNMRWPDSRNADSTGDTLGVPEGLTSEPGFIRWTPVEGATGYEVWYTNLGNDSTDAGVVSSGRTFSTITTVADEREYVTPTALDAISAPPIPGGSVVWRVRAKRSLYGTPMNNMPRASYGPWSGLYSAPVGEAPDAPSSYAVPLRTVSSDVVLSQQSLAHPPAGVVSDANSVSANKNMPVFVWSHDRYALHRVYVATDKDCVNVVYVGSVVGGTAWAPRTAGIDPAIPTVPNAINESVSSNEVNTDSTAVAPGGSATSTAPTQSQVDPHVDLWDNDWPTGGYYWTVVPVVHTSKGLQDLKVPQDACQQADPSGLPHMLVFKKTSSPAQLADGTAPYVTGLSPTGRLFSAINRQSRFYGAPLVAWQPASGAVGYDVEWSHKSYPWRTVGSRHTAATTAMLPLTPGTWSYRVRGVNSHIDGNTKMRWSTPLRIRIARPTFRVSGG